MLALFLAKHPQKFWLVKINFALLVPNLPVPVPVPDPVSSHATFLFLSFPFIRFFFAKFTRFAAFIALVGAAQLWRTSAYSYSGVVCAALSYSAELSCRTSGPLFAIKCQPKSLDGLLGRLSCTRARKCSAIIFDLLQHDSAASFEVAGQSQSATAATATRASSGLVSFRSFT